jgi:putative hydrolase of HD superfamily
VRTSESIADHSHRTVVIASAIAAMEGADPQCAAFLALFHDVQGEAACARDAEKLECLLQAVEHREQGNQPTQAWIDTLSRR